jgi:hypothetical protein
MLGKGLFNVGGPGESKKGPKLAVNHSPTILSCVSLKKNPHFFIDRDISAMNATAQRALERALARMEGMRWHEEERKVKS